ncbi:acyl-CoA dehydrogenase [Rhodopila sp.]|jgi:alkylation response protein AidB-like acyl-CoA dehydrogenase|uniref:acyl-CoA dehydrogenase n=1 Tax=Rhodopila sp. TaxID=2480087 RepID=UPI002B933D71|nr:acyl-CoA dehydrogenase [Rhodopila sp.]HVZ10159.1 acyl-CoA dehydrogenase [Rhodopila sp.]
MPVSERVAALVPLMRDRAAGLDRVADFPAEDMADLRRIGALTLALPVTNADPPSVRALHVRELEAVLTLTGSGNLATGRILEAHLNARHLIGRYGTAPQRRLGDEAPLLALWVTDPPSGGLRMRRDGAAIVLSGGKQFCSAAGHASHALVTAEDEGGRARMLLVPLRCGERVTPLPAPLAGMRASVTGAVDFSGCRVAEDAVLGGPGDYLREPDFSAGAWRGSAVALGGLTALVELAVAHLRGGTRLDHPQMLARFGHIFIARDTAALWVRRAGEAAEDPTRACQDRVATVGLGRLAVEAACLEAMTLIQQSIGLAAFRQGDPIERIGRDLQTYLRQPARDAVLADAAAWFAR